MSALHTRRSRTLTIALLMALLLALCVWYGSYGVAPELGAYPTEQVVGPTPDTYVGGPVALTGTVVATDPVEIRITYRGDQTRRVGVTDLDAPVERGDVLGVFGTLVDEDTVRATNSVVVPPGGHLYAYVVSFLAGLWVLARLVAQWRFDAGRLIRRGDPLTLDGLRARLRLDPREARDDA